MAMPMTGPAPATRPIGVWEEDARQAEASRQQALLYDGVPPVVQQLGHGPVPGAPPSRLAGSPLTTAPMSELIAPAPAPVPAGPRLIGTDHAGRPLTAPPVMPGDAAPAAPPPEPTARGGGGGGYGGGGGVRVIPGGPRVAGGTIVETPGVRLTPELIDGRNEVNTREKMGAVMRRGADRAKADLEAARQRERAKVTQEIGRDEDAILADMEADKNKAVDPQRFWRTKGTGERIAAGILTFFGKLGAGLAGRDRSGFEQIVDQAVARDIQEQENMFKQTRLNREDRLARLAARKVRLFEEVENKLGFYMDRARDEEEKAKYWEAITGIQAKKQAADEELYKAAQSRRQISTTWQNEKPQIIGGGGGGGGKKPKMDPKLYVPGIGYARTEVEARGMRAKKEMFDAVEKRLRRIREIQDIPRARVNPELRAEVNQLVKLNELAAATAYERGAHISESEQQAMKSVTGEGALSLFSYLPGTASPIATVDRGLSEISRMRQGMRAYVLPGTEDMVETPEGYKPEGEYTAPAPPPPTGFTPAR